MKYLMLLLLLAFASGSQAQSKRAFKTFDFKGKKIKYAIQLPADYDANQMYPVAIGPSEVKNDEDQSYYWRNVKDTYGWILLDFPIYGGKKDEAHD